MDLLLTDLGTTNLRDSVGSSAVGQGGGTRALCLVRGNDLSGVGHVTTDGVRAGTGSDASGEGEGSSEGLHLD